MAKEVDLDQKEEELLKQLQEIKEKKEQSNTIPEAEMKKKFKEDGEFRYYLAAQNNLIIELLKEQVRLTENLNHNLINVGKVIEEKK